MSTTLCHNTHRNRCHGKIFLSHTSDIQSVLMLNGTNIVNFALQPFVSQVWEIERLVAIESKLANQPEGLRVSAKHTMAPSIPHWIPLVEWLAQIAVVRSPDTLKVDDTLIVRFLFPRFA